MLSRLQNYGVYVVVVFSENNDELTQVGDESLDLSHFFDDDDDDDDNKNDDDETFINNGLVDLPTYHNETADEDTASESGSVVPGMHLSLLKAVQECENLDFSKKHCPGKALTSAVGHRLKASSDIYDKGTFHRRKRRAIKAGLIEVVYLTHDRTVTKNRSEKQPGLDLLSLTEKGRESLREALRGSIHMNPW